MKFSALILLTSAFCASASALVITNPPLGTTQLPVWPELLLEWNWAPGDRATTDIVIQFMLMNTTSISNITFKSDFPAQQRSVTIPWVPLGFDIGTACAIGLFNPTNASDFYATRPFLLVKADGTAPTISDYPKTISTTTSASQTYTVTSATSPIETDKSTTSKQVTIYSTTSLSITYTVTTTSSIDALTSTMSAYAVPSPATSITSTLDSGALNSSSPVPAVLSTSTPRTVTVIPIAATSPPLPEITTVTSHKTTSTTTILISSTILSPSPATTAAESPTSQTPSDTPQPQSSTFPSNFTTATATTSCHTTFPFPSYSYAPPYPTTNHSSPAISYSTAHSSSPPSGSIPAPPTTNTTITTASTAPTAPIMMQTGAATSPCNLFSLQSMPHLFLATLSILALTEFTLRISV